MRTSQLLKRPSAFLPIGMSLTALSVVAIAVGAFGAGPEPDEGTAAHLFQLLIAGQVPMVAWFAVTTLAQRPGEALLVLALQGVAIVAALTPVFLLGL